MQGDEITFKELIEKIATNFKHLKSKSVKLFAISLVGGLLGLGYAYFTKPLYKARLSFALEDDKGAGGLGGALGLASQFGFDLGGSTGGAFTGDNLIELMRSRTMVEKALLNTASTKSAKMSLADFYLTFNNDIRNVTDDSEVGTAFPINSNRSKFTRFQDSVLGVIHDRIVKKNLSVIKVDKKLSIITVSVVSRNEIFSKTFAEALVKEVSDFYVETKTKKSAQNLAILQHQTDSVRRVLNQAITGVALSTDNNPNPNAALQVLRTPSQRKQVDVQANTAILTELVKNLEVSKVALRKETPLIQVIDAPVLPLEKENVSKMISFLACFLVTFIIVSLFYTTKFALSND